MLRPPRLPRRKSGDQGFTLLEVMVALAILAVSMTSLMASHTASIRATRYAQQVTAIAFLAEYQLIEVEYIMRKEGGWVLEDKIYEGTFASLNWPDIKHRCVVDFLEIPDYSKLRAAKGRKMGHLTITGSTVEQVRSTALQAAHILGIAPF